MKLLVFWIVSLLWTQTGIFAIDLTSEIYSLLERYETSNDYMNDAYSKKYSKDPYWDALKNISDKSSQIKLSWVEYVEDILSKENCRMSEKKIAAILYYFSPDFRSEFARTLRMNWKPTDSKNYVFSWGVISEYCVEYYKCMNSDKNKTLWESMTSIENELVAATSRTIETNCKEFFLQYYDEWKSNELRKQAVNTSQLWNDKYWNASLEDSPYDIIKDIESVWKFLFEEVESPITPVFYNLPVFSNAAKSWWNSSSYGSRVVWNWWNNDVDNRQVSTWNWWNGRNGSENWGKNTDDWDISLPVNSGWDGIQSKWNAWNPTPLSDWVKQMEDDLYDDMVEWLMASDRAWIFRGVVNCNEDDVEIEVEPDISATNYTKGGVDSNLWELTQEEFQAAVDFVINAVDNYDKISAEKENEIKNKKWDKKESHDDLDGNKERSNNPQSEIDETVEEVKKCFDTCEWLRFDQKASCKLMCACGKWESEIFDPEKNPGLGPLAMIKFCTIPGVDGRFSVWGRKMVSIEEWINEIYWVVNKLSSEWRLWIWSQQNNHLDSSTKEMNFSKSLSFTIDINWADIFGKWSKQSKHYEEKEAQITNDRWKTDYHIKNSLDDPASKNRYRMDDEEVENGAWSVSVVDQIDVSKYGHYVSLSNDVSKWMDKEGEFWEFALEQFNNWIEYADYLISKK